MAGVLYPGPMLAPEKQGREVTKDALYTLYSPLQGAVTPAIYIIGYYPHLKPLAN